MIETQQNKELGTKAYLLHLYQMHKEGVFEQDEIIKLLKEASLDEGNVKSTKITAGYFNKVMHEVCIESSINTVTISLNLDQVNQSLLMFRTALIKNVKDER